MLIPYALRDQMSVTTFPMPACVVDIDETFLPVGQMRQITQVTSLEGAVIEGEVMLGPDHWVFPQHFPSDPIFPGTLIIEAAGQLVALWAWANGQRGRPRLVKTSAVFHHPAGPGVTHLVLRAEVRRKQRLHFGTSQVWADGILLASVEAVLAVLPLVSDPN